MTFEGSNPAGWEHILIGTSPESGPELALERARDGTLGVSMNGRRLHSRHDPLVEAERGARAIAPTRPDQLVVFFGAGLGYIVAEFLARNPQDCLWIEPYVDLLQHALGTAGVGEHLRSGRLRAIAGLPTEDLLERVFQGRANAGVIFYGHQSAYAASPTYRLLQKRCEDFLNRKSVNLATLARFDREWTHNLCQNFPHLMNANTVASLFDSAPGALGIVCGAGPSLADSFDEIRRVRAAGILIAVDTAVRPLVLAGIDPDIIVTVDPQAINRHYLEDYAGSAIFVVDPTTSYHCMRRLPPDRVYYASSPFPLARLFFEEAHGPPGEISFGGSVSTNAYDLATRLGCLRVILYGQDFGFSGGLAHVRGAVLEDRWNFMEERLRRRELHNHRQLSALPLRHLPRTGGGTLATNDKLLIFHGWFARRTAGDQRRGVQVANRTVGGALLPDVSTELSGAHKESTRGPGFVPPARAARDSALPDRLRRRLSALLGNVAELSAAAAQGLETARLLYAAAEAEGPLRGTYAHLLAEMDRSDQRVQAQATASDTVSSLMQGAIFRITEGSPSGKTLTLGADPSQERLRAAQGTIALYQALTEAARMMERLVGRALALIGETGA